MKGKVMAILFLPLLMTMSIYPLMAQASGMSSSSGNDYERSLKMLETFDTIRDLSISLYRNTVISEEEYIIMQSFAALTLAQSLGSIASAGGTDSLILNQSWEELSAMSLSILIRLGMQGETELYMNLKELGSLSPSFQKESD